MLLFTHAKYFIFLLLLLLSLLLLLLLLLFLMCTCEQHTYTSSEHFHLEELRRNHARPGQRKFSCPGRESNSRPSKSHHSRETNRKIMAGILSYEPAFDRKIAENSWQSLKRDRRASFPASKWTKILGTLVCI